nr:class I SAM-dependent methyltransferase [Chloroflexia bacterium]
PVSLVPIPGDPVPVRDPGAWLLDPNPAVTRAGLVADLARSLGAWQLDERIAFLSTDTPVPSPFARTLRVIASMPWHEKRLRTVLRELAAGPITIRRRGLAGDVDALTHRLRGPGPNSYTVAMTRVANKPWALLCEDST